MTSSLRRALQTWLSGVTLLTGLLLGGPALATAPERKDPQGQLAFKTFSTEEGLKNLGVLALAQDREGFIWVGTENRVFRFDGARFEPFGTKEGLPSSVIHALHLQSDGTLWAGTLKGLARWDGTRFEAVEPEAGLLEEDVVGMTDGPNGELWVSTSQGPFRRVQGGRFLPVPGWLGRQVSALASAHGGLPVWAASWSGSQATLLRWDGRSWTSYPVAPRTGETPISALLVGPHGTVWARSLSGLDRLEPGSPAFRTFQPAIPPTEEMLITTPPRSCIHARQAAAVHSTRARWLTWWVLSICEALMPIVGPM